MRFLLAACLGLFACAQGQRGLPIPDGAPNVDAFLDIDASMDDLAVSHPDLSDVPDLASSDLAGGCAHPFINEVQTDGVTASDEFIELYNACSQPILLTGWKLAYRSATNATATDTNTIVAFSSGSIASHGYYLVANNGFTGTATPDVKYSSGLAKTGGGVGLRDPNGTLMDAVGWGSANNPFVETMAAPLVASSHSIARHPDGHDTDNNSTDFTDSTPTPKASN